MGNKKDYKMQHKGMPDEIAEIFDALFNEVCEMRARWQLYCELFTRDKETIALLNWSASEFFGLVQWLLADDVSLSLSRITDPAKNRSQENLSLHTLVDRIGQAAYPAFSAELNSLILDVTKAVEVVRKLRSKKIAHNDLQIALKDPKAVFSGPTKLEIDRALQTVERLMNHVETFFDQLDPDREIELPAYSASELLDLLAQAKSTMS